MGWIHSVLEMTRLSRAPRSPVEPLERCGVEDSWTRRRTAFQMLVLLARLVYKSMSIDCDDFWSEMNDKQKLELTKRTLDSPYLHLTRRTVTSCGRK